MVAGAVPAKSMNIYQRLMAWFCFPLEVIWKHHMGERHGGLVKLAVAGFIAYWWVGYIDIFFMADHPAIHPQIKTRLTELEQADVAMFCFFGFLFLYGILGLANVLEIRRRKKAGIKLHSYFMGVPRFLPNQPFVHSLVIPAVDFLIGLGVFQIIRPLGIYLCLGAVFQRWIFKSIFKQERRREMDQQDRIALQEWKSGQHSTAPTSLVRVAKNNPAPITTDDTMFKERWKKVLKSSGSKDSAL